jgi:hypothetical protein
MQITNNQQFIYNNKNALRKCECNSGSVKKTPDNHEVVELENGTY